QRSPPVFKNRNTLWRARQMVATRVAQVGPPGDWRRAAGPLILRARKGGALASDSRQDDRPISYRPAVPAASIAVGLSVLWLLLSGQMAGWFLTLGVLSVALATVIAIRMDLIDHEGAPVHIYRLTTTRYWLWLLVEIAKADWYIAKYVFRPLSDLSPTLFRAPATQKSALGQAIYANSITLTPGTVTVDIEPGTVVVHAITEEAASGVQEGEMDRRVRELE